MNRNLAITILFVAAILWPDVAGAKPQHKESLAKYYGSRLAAELKACATCHVVPPGTPEAKLAELGAEHNAFGRQLEELGERLTAAGKPATIPLRLAELADQDADLDGISNELELLAGTLPGSSESKPTMAALETSRARQQEFRAEYRWEPFRSVTRPAPPHVPSLDRDVHPIDAFLAAEHARQGLTVRPTAPPHVLLRRVHLDLVGLPPTPEQVREFLADPSPAAYEQVVERLLASPAYGQRWGRHWMDVWRYSDWAGWGAQVRDSMPHIWRWRDWIIDSLNADKPYDRMVLEMLAADELAPEDVDALRATGFLVRNYKRLSREQWITDTVNHTTKAFLGITLECARCHDHMYDPFAQDEYYRFRAVFEPHNVRTDRVPGQVNTEKDGLVRTFDADPVVPTYFFVRGDERQADKQRAMQPGVPAALGGATFTPREISFSQAVRMPDKRPFVQDDDLRAATDAIVAARTQLAAARQKLDDARRAATAPGADAAKSQAAIDAAQRDLRLAELDLPLAEARRAALEAVIHVERLEDSGARQQDAAAWESAAKTAVVAQRHEAVATQQRARQVAADAEAKVQAALDVVQQKLVAKPDDAAIKVELDKATKAVDDAKKAVAAAAEVLAKAEQALSSPASTEYTQRKLTTYPEKSTGRRLALARWIVDRQNPLAARVAVNHLWLRHFGQPLVASVFDFGNNGQPPALPALVDWLAAEFMEPSLVRHEGRWQRSSSSSAAWSMKHVHRLIVTSAAYRRASTPDAASTALDPDNKFYWQMPPRRLEAEVVRDCVLQIAGHLDHSMGGPDIDYQQGLTNARRSLYFRHAPEKQMTFLRVFDAASPNECYRRKESIIPQQALALVNSPLAIEQSRRLARRLHAARPADDPFIDEAFLAVLSRPAREDERGVCRAFLADQQALFERNVAKLTEVASDVADVGRPAADRALRSRENLVLVLINHHDFVTIR